MTDPVVVLRTQTSRPGIVIGLLDAHRHPGELRTCAAAFSLTINGLGEVRSVPGNRAEEASRILADYRRPASDAR